MALYTCSTNRRRGSHSTTNRRRASRHNRDAPRKYVVPLVPLSGPARPKRSAVAVSLLAETVGFRRCVGFGVPVVECRLLGRLSRVRRTSGCCWKQRGRPAGAPGPRYARRLARARGSVYRRQHGTPCPPLLPPRRPLAKREQRRELSFTWLSCPCPLLEESRVSFLSFIPPAISRKIAIGALFAVCVRPGTPAMWLESGSLRAPRNCNVAVGISEREARNRLDRRRFHV